MGQWFIVGFEEVNEWFTGSVAYSLIEEDNQWFSGSVGEWFILWYEEVNQ